MMSKKNKAAITMLLIAISALSVFVVMANSVDNILYLPLVYGGQEPTETPEPEILVTGWQKG